MKFYAMVDTNVLVSALLSQNSDSATVQVIQRMLAGSDSLIQQCDYG